MAESQSILVYILTVRYSRQALGPRQVQLYLHELSMAVTVRSVKREICEEAC
jgi:hypothetical protein